MDMKLPTAKFQPLVRAHKFQQFNCLYSIVYKPHNGRQSGFIIYTNQDKWVFIELENGILRKLWKQRIKLQTMA